MKILAYLRLIAMVLIIFWIVRGVIMMIGDFMGVVAYNQQLVIVGLATILLSEFYRGRKASTALFAVGFLLIIFG